MNKKYYILTLLLFCTTLLFAQNVRFTASASKTEVGTGEQFEITFSLNANGDNFTPPNITGFQLLGGPNVSQSMSSINGVTTMSNAYSYDLLAVKEGEFTIGPATIMVNGRKLSTNPIKIKVVKGQPVTQGNRNQNAPDNTVTAPASSDLSKLIFIKAVVDKSSVYLGQQLTVSYRLYTRVGIDDSQADKLPDLNGFFSEDIKPKQQQVQWHVETVKGERFNVADIKQSVLFPEHTGNITIDALSMNFIVRQPVAARDIMDQFFGGGYKQVKYSAKSTPVVIHVKPLPDTGKPDSFTGAIGKFEIDADVDKTDLKANDALNYKVKVTGTGNLKLLKTISANFPADFEKYDPKVVDTITLNENGEAGSRIYNYLLIPRHGGDFTIDPIKFSYFNPATNRYVTLTTKAFHIKVAKGKTENNVTAFSDDKQDVKILDKDIRYIKTDDGNLSNEDHSFYGSAGFYLLLLAGPVLCIGAFNYRNRMRKINSDVVLVKSKRAGKVAAKHLAIAQKQLQTNNSKAFYEAIFKGLYGYLSDKLNISYANLDRETISSALKARNLDDKSTNQLLETLDLCEMARYAPVTHISEQQVFEKSKDIINDIESKI